MRKPTRSTIVFGEAGLKEIEYLGDLPAVFGPFYTRKIYRFRLGKNPRLVDVRDLPSLTKAAGRKRLRDINEPEEEKKPRGKKVTIQPEPEEVNDGTT
jgi:hypothetical protein